MRRIKDFITGKLRHFIWKWTMFFLNPRLLFCLALGWMITNGWSYLFVAIGTATGTNWMIVLGTAYLSFLWFPFTPEKIVTVFLAILFMKRFFPKDEKTVKVLHEKLQQMKKAFSDQYGKFRAKKKQRAATQDAVSKPQPETAAPKAAITAPVNSAGIATETGKEPTEEKGEPAGNPCAHGET